MTQREWTSYCMLERLLTTRMMFFLCDISWATFSKTFFIFSVECNCAVACCRKWSRECDPVSVEIWFQRWRSWHCENRCHDGMYVVDCLTCLWSLDPTLWIWLQWMDMWKQFRFCWTHERILNSLTTLYDLMIQFVVICQHCCFVFSFIDCVCPLQQDETVLIIACENQVVAVAVLLIQAGAKVTDDSTVAHITSHCNINTQKSGESVV